MVDDSLIDVFMEQLGGGGCGIKMLETVDL